MKVCRKCGVVKELTEFWREKARPDGLQTRCKDCQRGDHRAWYSRNPEDGKAHSARWKASNPERAAQLHRESTKAAYWRDPEKAKKATVDSQRKARESLGDRYIKERLLKKIGCKYSEIPQQLIEPTRAYMAVRRKIKEKTR